MKKDSKNKQSRKRGKAMFITAQACQTDAESIPTEQVVIRALADLRALCCGDWGLDFTKLVMESRKLYLSEKPKETKD